RRAVSDRVQIRSDLVADAVQRVTLRAYTLEDDAAPLRVAALLHGGLVTLQYVLPLTGFLFEERPCGLAKRGIAAHEKLALVTKRESPRLYGVPLDRLEQHVRPFGIEKHRICRVHGYSGCHGSPELA